MLLTFFKNGAQLLSPYEKTPVTYSLSVTGFLFALKASFARDNEALPLILYLIDCFWCSFDPVKHRTALHFSGFMFDLE